jgi:hypothetical protein
LPVANHKANAGPRPLAARTHARSNPTPSTPIESSPGPRELPGTSAGPPPTFYYRSSRAVYTQRDAPTILWPNYRLRWIGLPVGEHPIGKGHMLIVLHLIPIGRYWCEI